MASARKSQWKTLQRFAENLVFTEAPKLVRHLQNTQETLRTIRQAVKITANIMTTAVPSPPAEIAAGRPVTSTSCPTAARARRLVYAPDLDGRADPGEIVWTWVAYEQDPTRGKDRPVLVVGRDRSVLLGLLVSQPGAPCCRPGLGGNRFWRLGLRGPRKLGTAGPGARRTRGEYPPRRRDSGTRGLRRGSRPAACRLRLALNRAGRPAQSAGQRAPIRPQSAPPGDDAGRPAAR